MFKRFASHKQFSLFCLILGLLLATQFVVHTEKLYATGNVYYVAPNGSDQNGGSENAPWGTFSYALKTLRPGDTLTLKNGTYNQTLNITVSGTETAPITIRAENDGGAIIDGQGVQIPFNIFGSSQTPYHDIIVEGIRCQNSKESVVAINYVDRVTLKRVSAYGAGSGNYHVFDIYKSTHLLLEDIIASGSGRVMYDVLDSQYVTLRRCWGRWVSHSGGGGPNYIVQIYGSDDCIVENLVGTVASGITDVVGGIAVWCNTNNVSANRNKIFGNVLYGGFLSWAYCCSSAIHRIEGNRFINNVSINNQYGFFQRADADMRASNLTIVGNISQAFALQETSDPKDADFEIKGDVRNSIFLSGDIGFNIVNSSHLTSFTNAYNGLYQLGRPYIGIASQGLGEIAVDPGFNTSKYSKGGYLFVPDESPLKNSGEVGTPMGAEVLYRYQNGALTSEPLWPWPMEDRIFAETGVGVTWEANGGLWKTLEGVYLPGALIYYAKPGTPRLNQ